jgi:hypothetical protein
MSRTFYIIFIASLIALSGIVAFWSTLPSRFIGGPIGGASVMEIPMQSGACNVQALEAVSGSTSPEGENLLGPGICRKDWVRGRDAPAHNCELLFGPA